MANITSKIALFFKGMAMGTVDIVPGVSGSTVAVLLGIYERFIGGLKNINPALIRALLGPFAHRFNAESRRDAAEAAKKADLPWLLTLMAGLGTAFVVASFVIPTLMDRFPDIMRGIFFGLVLGSIATPIRSIKKWRILHFLTIILFAGLFFTVLGQQVSAPVAVENIISAEGQTLTEICLKAPCFNSTGDILAMPENAALRDLTAASANPAAEILPAGLEISIQKPVFWYCLLAGFMAICAMLLPGVSGSFVLLVLGSYYFMLNTGKGFMAALSHGEFYGSHLFYIGCFAFGALAGIVAFSRVLTWLLKNHREMTLAAIIGILLGCLRGVWPYRIPAPDGSSTNVLPSTEMQLFWPVLAAIACGLAVVAATVFIQIHLEKKELENAHSEGNGSQSA